MKTDKSTIERLRRDLPIFRTVAGWSAERLASLLDVSRSTILNLENTPHRMSVVQYLAIRCLFQEEISESRNQLLDYLLQTLVDGNAPESERQAILEEASNAARQVGRKSGSEAIGRATAKALLSAFGTFSVTAGAVTAAAMLGRNTIAEKSKAKLQNDPNGGESEI